MYLFWHVLFATLFAFLACRIVKPNPARIYLLVTAFFGIFPDIDHLLCWSQEFFSKLIPRHLTDGLSISLRTHVYPCYLHLWLWPTVLCLTAIILRRNKLLPYILGAAMAWGLHLALDGVIALI